MEARYLITGTEVRREVAVGPGQLSVAAVDPVGFAIEAGKRMPMETGIMPPGVVSLRQAGNHLQIVMLCPPGVNLVNWTHSEGEGRALPLEKIVYQLAQPWRVIIGDFSKGNLLGARIFYSPEAIGHVDQALYHQNVPNLNCYGYGQHYIQHDNWLGVGWVCLYLKEDWSVLPIAEKARRLMERCSGVEVFNDNMTETDGRKLYKEHGKPAYCYERDPWEKKSQKEGFAWTLDPDLWIPVLVKGVDDQGRHTPGGVPLTLGMAMEGSTRAYYSDTDLPKLTNALRRGEGQPRLEAELWAAAFVASPPIGAPVIAEGVLGEAPGPPGQKVVQVAPAAPLVEYADCTSCGEDYEKTTMVTFGDKLFCANCAEDELFFCPACGKQGELEADGYFNDVSGLHENVHPGCVMAICATCGKGWTKNMDLPGLLGDGACKTCVDWFACGWCNVAYSMASHNELPVVSATLGQNNLHLCDACFEDARRCTVCGQISPSNVMVRSFDNNDLCPACSRQCQGCGVAMPVMQGENCPSCVDVTPVAS